MFSADPIKDMPGYYAKVQQRYGGDLIMSTDIKLSLQGLFRLSSSPTGEFLRFCWGADPLTARPYEFRFKADHISETRSKL